MADLRHSLAGSGDLLADRRFAYAEASLAEGDAQAARDLYTQTLELAPLWLPARLGLAKALLMLGDAIAAIDAFRAVAAQDPRDSLGARAFLAQLQAEDGAITPGYVAALFDDYAPRFDQHLTSTLDYRVPEMIAEALGEMAGGLGFRRGLDLGCGTGLMARALAGRVKHLFGVDLSEGMLDIARQSGLYVRLDAGDGANWLACEATQSADLILAADVFCYIENLMPIFVEAHRVLEPNGLFAFSIQRSSAGDIVVGSDLRVHHALSHIRDLARHANFAVLLAREVGLRKDRGQTVQGAVFVLKPLGPL